MSVVLVFTLGATALQRYHPKTGRMELRVSPEELLETAAPSGVTARLQRAFPYRSGAELTYEVLLEVATAIAAAAADPSVAGCTLLCGTDTAEEAAFALHLMLAALLRRHTKALTITGAMLPADAAGGSDGPRNLGDAITVAAHPTTAAAVRGGVLLVMNDGIHLAQHVYKADSQLIGAFHSHPGPIGQLRSGRPVWYYAPPSALGADLPSEAFLQLQPEQLSKRVAIWPLGVSAFLPEALLGELDGLVLAGSGTGSLPAALVEQLAPAWTARLPIVVVSRCPVGQNYDDNLYRGSREKYESRGFILGRGYEQLNPLQARTLLVLRLSAHGTA